jgi:hypothetical protein
VILLPGPPKLGPPTSYFHCIWLPAQEDEPFEFYDELDASRWSTRCVRRFRDGSLKACSYSSADWRDEMPETAFPNPDEINKNPEFIAKEISKAEFEAIWQNAMRILAD